MADEDSEAGKHEARETRPSGREERAPEHDEGAPAARGTRGLAAASGDEIVSLNCVSSM